jgi:hypothetical protein
MTGRDEVKPLTKLDAELLHHYPPMIQTYANT